MDRRARQKRDRLKLATDPRQNLHCSRFGTDNPVLLDAEPGVEIALDREVAPVCAGRGSVKTKS